MAKNIKIIPGSGLFEFSGSTASTINLTYNSTGETLNFAGAHSAILLHNTTLYETDAHFNINNGKVKIGGSDRINSSGVWQGPASPEATGDKGTKG